MATQMNTMGTQLLENIADLNEKKDEMNRQIVKAEEDRAKVTKEMSILTARLQAVNASIVRKSQARNEYDKTVQECEAAYMKILESSQTLLHVMKREAAELRKQ